MKAIFKVLLFFWNYKIAETKVRELKHTQKILEVSFMEKIYFIGKRISTRDSMAK